jgi:8-oxo-dGTP pyrophosphatase MutT (NUDIX family)
MADAQGMTGRDWLLARLADYRPRDPEDGARHARLTRFVEVHSDCFARALEEGHVVASAWVVDPSRRRVLLHHHRRLDRWLQFGGHVDFGDATVLAAARRELEEESGLAAAEPLGGNIFDLDVHPIPARPPGPDRPAEPAHLHYDVRFAFQADPDAPVAASAESRALRWVDLDEVPALSGEGSLLRMVARTPGLSPAPR